MCVRTRAYVQAHVCVNFLKITNEVQNVWVILFFYGNHISYNTSVPEGSQAVKRQT